jgi:RNA polymerase subunit RPABC4/transcription elongation factor Spt4
MVFVSHDVHMNALTTGLWRPYIIILYSALIEAMDDDELKSVIGHEMGHIKFQHVWLQSLLGTLGSQSFSIPLLGDLIGWCFHFWGRFCEFTADRAGLIACGNLEKAIMAEIKLGVGPELAKKVNIEALAQQAQEARRNFVGELGDLGRTHAHMTTRIQQMADFATSEMFKTIRPDIELIHKEAEKWITKKLITEESMEKKICSNCNGKMELFMTFCPHCGASNSNSNYQCEKCNTPMKEGWKVCPQCGESKKTSNLLLCNKCRKPVEAGWVECPQCGNKLGDV